MIVEAGPFLFSIVSGWPWVNPSEVTVCFCSSTWFSMVLYWGIFQRKSVPVGKKRYTISTDSISHTDAPCTHIMLLFTSCHKCFTWQNLIISSYIISFDIWLNYYCTKSCDSDKLCSCELFPFFNPILEKVVFFLSPCYLLSIWKYSVKFCWLAIE